MFLATGSSFDFMQFLQILCWILLPALLLAVILTVFLHYRKKRIEKAEEETEEALVMGSPEMVGYTKGDGEYICFDHSPLISEYKNRLSFTHARFTALRHDFEKLESRYTALAGYAIAHFKNKNAALMENTNEEMPRQLREEIDRIVAQYKAEKDELQTRLEQLNQSFKSLEDENQSLQDQVNIHLVSGEEKETIYSRWKEENRVLKEKVAEQQYLQDLVEEKNAQLVFLQNQVEQRIKAQHAVEHQRTKLESELEDLNNRYTDDHRLQENLKRELLQKQEEMDKLQVLLCAREEQLSEQQQLAASKQEQVTLLENTLSETRNKDDNLNAMLSEANEKIAALQAQLAAELEKNQFLEQHAMTSKESLKRIYHEVSAVMGEGNTQSPVIPLRPDYIDRPGEEIAVH